VKGSVAGTPERIADSPMTTAIVMDAATKKNRIQVSFEKARLVIGGPSTSVSFKDEPQWRERLARSLKTSLAYLADHQVLSTSW
jgi:hypothetical protein